MYRTLTFVVFCYTAAYNYDDLRFWNIVRENRNTPDELNLNETYFLPLKNYQVNAKTASEIDYPWIARIIHSQKDLIPHICTAICIEKNIFISAARCVYILKVVYTSLLYQGRRLIPKAFVIPTNESKQMYDDIGFIVVNSDFEGDWKTVQLYDQKRPDNVFEWLEKMKFDDFEHKIIGYASFKADTVNLKREYYLTQLDVNVDINLCREILVYNQRISGFNVPCYHSCTFAQFEGKDIHKQDSKCIDYHGAEGSALINVKSNKIFGVATWGAYFHKYELPVGFAVPNSNKFHEDRACAIKIRDDDEFSPPEGYFQKLCDSKRKSRYMFGVNHNNL